MGDIVFEMVQLPKGDPGGFHFPATPFTGTLWTVQM